MMTVSNTKETRAARPEVLPIDLTVSQVRPVAYRILSKKHGLNLKSSGLEVVAKLLGHNFGVDWRSARAEKFLDEVARQWKDQDRGLFIEGEALAEIARDILNTGAERAASPGVALKTQTIDDSLIQDAPVSSKQFSWKDHFKVIDAYSQPRYHYDPVKKYFEQSITKPHALAPAADQALLYQTRYNLVHNRILRNETFQTPSFQANVTASMAGNNFYSITQIKNMLGRDNSHFLLFGMIAKGPDGNWWLQDSSGKIELEVSEAVADESTTYYLPGNLILCDGVYFNEKFIVGTIGSPPAEKREVTKTVYGNLDFLGVHTPSRSGSNARIDRIDKASERQLVLQEREHSHHRIIVLGADIFLDELRVVDALRKLFGHLQRYIGTTDVLEEPIAIIFPGSFKSTPFQANGSSTSYKESFDFLAQLLGEFTTLASSVKLVFVPGDNDAWASTFSSGTTPLWPLHAIPKLFTGRVTRVAPDTAWGSNPCRISYLSQEIVVVRDDYGARFRRNAIVLPSQEASRAADREAETLVKASQQTAEPLSTDSDDDERASLQRDAQRMLDDNQKPITQTKNAYVPPDVAEARKVIKTLLDQAHLAPFPLSKRPVAWAYDHALHLTTLPSMIVLADPSTPPFRATYEGCHVINPGRLIQGNKVCWVEYNPSRASSEPKFIYL